MVLGVIAVSLRTLPGFNLPRVIHFRKIQNGPAAGTSLDRRPRIIESAFSEIKIAGGIAEYAGAIAPPASMKRPDFFRIFLQHHPLHRGMVQIAEGSEFLPGRHGSGLQFSLTIRIPNPAAIRMNRISLKFESSQAFENRPIRNRSRRAATLG